MLYALSYPKEPMLKETMNRTANTAVVFLTLPFKMPVLFHVEFSSQCFSFSFNAIFSYGKRISTQYMSLTVNRNSSVCTDSIFLFSMFFMIHYTPTLPQSGWDKISYQFKLYIFLLKLRHLNFKRCYILLLFLS